MGLLLRGGAKGRRGKRKDEKKGEGRDHHGLQPPRSKFSGYVGL